MQKPNYRFYIAVTIFLVPLFVAFLAYKTEKPTDIVGSKIVDKVKPVAKKPQTLPVPNTKSLTIAAVGDVMFDRRVESAINANGASWPFAKAGPHLRADLTIANLESSLASTGKAEAKKDVTFQGTPLGVQSLKHAGIDIVSLANNHALDYGLSSLEQTRGLLKKNGIAFSGAGANKDEAYEPAIVKVGDLKVGFLSFSDIIPFNSFPSAKLPGIAPARDPAKVAAKIKALAKKVHLVVVAFHWGEEYKDHPNGKQKLLATSAIDAGADLVIGHHPHVIQGVAVYKDRLILYSLGNFVFDHFKPLTGDTFIARTEMDNKGRINFARIIPVVISSSGQPNNATGNDGVRILNRIKTLSGKYGNRMKIENNSLTLSL